jgi:hypothetical protein
VRLAVVARVVRHRHFVRQKIEIDWLVAGGGPKLRDLGTQLLCVEHAGRERAKTTGPGDCDRKLGIHGAGHRRQQDRMINFEQIEQSAVRPHGR